MSKSVVEQSKIGCALEENILVLLDTVGVKEAEDIEDAKLQFLDAVRSVFLGVEVKIAPARAIYEEVFNILDGNHSTILNIASYNLLVDLDKLYPRVMVSCESASDATKGLSLQSKIWSPFAALSEQVEKHPKSQRPLQEHSHENFISLLITLGSEILEEQGVSKEPIVSNLATHQILGLGLKFKYLVSVIEEDFRPRVEVFQENQDSDVLMGSHLVQIFKGTQRQLLLRLLLRLIAAVNISMVAKDETIEVYDIGSSLHSLLSMLMEFDIEHSRKPHSSPKRTRQEPRTSIWELIMEIIGYEKSLLAPLLQALVKPGSKLRIIFGFFIKNAPQSYVTHIRENLDRTTIQDLLNFFSLSKDAKIIYTKIETNILELLLAEAFKAFLMLVQDKGGPIEMTVFEVCEMLKKAFENLLAVSSDFELDSAGRQALICAELLLAQRV